jgi:hypothetical protein
MTTSPDFVGSAWARRFQVGPSRDRRRRPVRPGARSESWGPGLPVARRCSRLQTGGEGPGPGEYPRLRMIGRGPGPVCADRARQLHQQIGVKLFPIICFTPQLFGIIGKYLRLLLLFVCEKFCYYLLLLYQGLKVKTLIIVIIRKLLLQLFFSAINFLHNCN